MMNGRPQVLIAGGGLAGCLVAIALVERRPEVRLLLIEQGDRFGGQHVWSFFESDLDPEQRALIAPLITRSWDEHEIAFPRRQRILSTGYNSVRSAALDEQVQSMLSPDQYLLGSAIAHVAQDHVVLGDGERIDAELVLDARGPDKMHGIELGWQKFMGRTYRFEAPHGVSRPMIMDACVEQRDGFRFVYLLPFSSHELMIEDTYYSDQADLDVRRLGAGLDIIAASHGSASIIDEETGVLPVLLEGDVQSLWTGAPVPKLGIRGGFFHPTTGYSLADAAANALFLARQKDLSAGHIYAALLGRAERLWKERHFFQLLNRMLFRAAPAHERYRVLEHFYRLPEATIARFYAAELTILDKVRILSGKPPVPVGRALSAARRQVA